MYDNIGNGLHRGYKMKILELIFTKGKTFFLKVKSPLQAVAKELFLCGPISKIKKKVLITSRWLKRLTKL